MRVGNAAEREVGTINLTDEQPDLDYVAVCRALAEGLRAVADQIEGS